MRTDDLIASLGAELLPTRPHFLHRSVVMGLGSGAGIAALAFALFWGTRSGLVSVFGDPFLAAKTILPLLLATLAMPEGLARARPGGQSAAGAALWIVPAILAALLVAAVLVTPQSRWAAEFLGTSIGTCLVSIPILSAPILAGLLIALRRGAPEHPMRCGAAAGMVAGGLGAAIYSVYCIEDSPLFYGVWYTLAIGAVMAIAALIGHRLLRW